LPLDRADEPGAEFSIAAAHRKSGNAIAETDEDVAALATTLLEEAPLVRQPSLELPRGHLMIIYLCVYIINLHVCAVTAGGRERLRVDADA
jgi:hypothetical protein